MRACSRLTLVAGGVLVAAAGALPAQTAGVARGDSLLRVGDVDGAEAAYYAAVRVRPRDPAARLALGRLLAVRGALRIGMVLIEEARQFGLDSTVAARELAPIYRMLGLWQSLRDLPPSALQPGEREQAAWLVAHPPSVAMPDSAAVAYAPIADAGAPGGAVGRVLLHVGGDTVTAVIDPEIAGIVLDASVAGRRTLGVQSIAGDRAGARSVVIGPVSLGNVPVSLAPAGMLTGGVVGAGALVGLDVLRPFAPSFDPARGRVTLRKAGRVPMSLPGTRYPILLTPFAIFVVREGRLEPATSPVVLGLLRTRPWTLDARRGAIVVGR